MERNWGLTKLELLLSPRLRVPSLRLVDLLKARAGELVALFLDIPAELEGETRGLARKALPYHGFITRIQMEGIIPEPLASWVLHYEPILKALPSLKEASPHLSVHCYGSSRYEHASMELSGGIASLTLRTAITGDVEVQRWRATLTESLKIERDMIALKAETVIGRNCDEVLLISEPGNRALKKPLTEAGYDVKVRWVGAFHHFTPLGILSRIFSRRFVTDEEITEHVQHLLDYIQGYIYKYQSRDRAYYEWVYENAPWLRRRMDAEEIRLLDRIS
jgi:hypothetical protein